MSRLTYLLIVCLVISGAANMRADDGDDAIGTADDDISIEMLDAVFREARDDPAMLYRSLDRYYREVQRLSRVAVENPDEFDELGKERLKSFRDPDAQDRLLIYVRTLQSHYRDTPAFQIANRRQELSRIARWEQIQVGMANVFAARPLYAFSKKRLYAPGAEVGQDLVATATNVMKSTSDRLVAVGEFIGHIDRLSLMVNRNHDAAMRTYLFRLSRIRRMMSVLEEIGEKLEPAEQETADKLTAKLLALDNAIVLSSRGENAIYGEKLATGWMMDVPAEKMLDQEREMFRRVLHDMRTVLQEEGADALLINYLYRNDDFPADAKVNQAEQIETFLAFDDAKIVDSFMVLSSVETGHWTVFFKDDDSWNGHRFLVFVQAGESRRFYFNTSYYYDVLHLRPKRRRK